MQQVCILEDWDRWILGMVLGSEKTTPAGSLFGGFLGEIFSFVFENVSDGNRFGN